MEVAAVANRCLTLGLPKFGGATGSFRRIVQTPGGITMFYPMFDNLALKPLISLERV